MMPLLAGKSILASVGFPEDIYLYMGLSLYIIDAAAAAAATATAYSL
jgi:hypothetical protein